MDMPGLLAFTRMTGDLVKAMRACPQPIIAAIDGICAGAGAIIAMRSDMRMATARSKIAFLFVRVGLAGADMGACAILPRIIGQGRASELLYTGRVDGRRGGRALGLLQPPGRTRASCWPTRRRWPRTSPTARPSPTRMTKTMLHQEWNWASASAIEAEAQAQAICMQTKDYERAYHAFVAKQKPVFEGN